MYQDIVIGPDIIDFVRHHGYDPENLEENPVNELDKMLSIETLWFDKENRLEDLFFERVVEIGDQIAYNWWEMRFGDIDKKRYNSKHLEEEIGEPSVKYNIKKEDQIEGSIVKKVRECIWLKSEDSLKTRIKYIRQITTAVNPISFDNYINPDPKHKVIKNGQVWDLKQGDDFPFPKIYYPIFKIAKTVKILDPYILHPKYENGERNLISIIEACANNCEIKVETLKQSQRKDKDDFPSSESIENWKVYLMEKYNDKNLEINHPRRKLDLMERCIKTDIAEIFLGHGLQAYDHDTSKVAFQTKPYVIKS